MLSISGNAVGATLVTDIDGKLMGADGIDINGTEYNVDFVEGSCYSLFAPCLAGHEFTFNINEALDASWALRNQVFEIPEWSVYDSTPTMTNGCEGAVWSCTIFTAYAAGADNMGSAMFENGDGLFFFNNVTTCGNCYKADDTADMAGAVYAVWEEANGPSPVPVPAAAWLFGSGLLGLVGVARRKKS
jgi:hypothetical protein